MESSTVYYEFCDEEGSCENFKQMDDFRQEGTFCDVILSTEDGHEFQAHRLVLASSSAYFRAMFLTDMKESQQKRITIRGVSSNSLRALIEYTYSSKIRVCVDNVENILSAASMLQFIRVEEACYDFLSNNIEVSNCIDVWNLSELHECTELVDRAESFIRGNFTMVLKSPEYFCLTPKQLARLLCHDKLNVPSESSVFGAVMSWVKHDLSTRKQYLVQFLEHIRLPLLTRKFLIDTVAQEELVMNDPKCREYVIEAIDYHLIPERRTKALSPRTIPREKSSRCLFVVGGEEGNAVLNSAECFDFDEKRWKQIAPMIIPRKYVGAAILDGQLYAVGGVNREYSDLVTVECFNPCSEQWTSVSSLNKCKGALAVAVMEGWLYAAGGSHNGSALKCVERYDPIKNEWSQVACMRLPRSHFGMAALQGRLYAIGGYCGISEIEHVEYYEPMSNKWSDVSSMNKTRMNHCVVSYSDRIYVIGGTNSIGVLDSIEKYNPDLNLWLVIRNTMDPRSGASAAAIFGTDEGAQDLYIIGGHDHHNKDLNTVKKLNLKFADYSSVTAASMVQARVFAGVATA